MSEQSEILRRELKNLQLEAEKILDEIDAKEAEILQIEKKKLTELCSIWSSNAARS